VAEPKRIKNVDKGCRPSTARFRGNGRIEPAGFTLIELLLVVAVIAILAAMLMPTLSSAKKKAKQSNCVSNLRQLELGAQLYTQDNNGRLLDNLPLTQYPASTNCWVLGNMKEPSEAINSSLLKRGTLFPYAGQAGLYHCPADVSQAQNQLRLRSYSMNGWFGSRIMEEFSQHTAFRTFMKDTELSVARPSALWQFADEHPNTIDDGWFLVTMDDSIPFASAPGTAHQNGYDLSFADGHVENYKLRDPASAALGQLQAHFTAGNTDWQRLKQATTIR
jgi:prepilin-type N-terminal cleavage/methylation domain-containing protein/prepilin-type processing-associated H-X9-DG protein